MTGPAHNADDLIGTLSVLRRHEPDASRAARTLARGRARLHARRLAREAAPARWPSAFRWPRAAEQLLAAAAAVIFLAEVLVRATRLYGL